jgi:glycine betaine catabolism B
MKTFKARLVSRIKRTETVESFRFASEEGLDFLPGQFVQVVFDEGSPNNRDLNKYLSFSSSPEREYFEVTKRLSESLFSQSLKKLKSGDDVCFKGPMGGCVFLDEYKKIGFIIGGIGITPVISIMEHIMEKKLMTDVQLIYSNRKEEDIAFRSELESWQKQNSRLKITFAVTECPPKDKTCVFGHINNDLLKGTLLNITERVFFIFGPPKMVNELQQCCVEIGIPKESVKVEKFMGY